MKSNDLTQGNIFRNLIRFMIPLIIGNIFQQAYSLVDAIIVGKILGDTAFAGVSSTGSASFLILGFAGGLTAGLTIPTAQYYGAKNQPLLKKSITTALTLSAAIALLLTTIALIGCRSLLEVLSTSETLMPFAYAYLFAIFAGIGATIFYNIVCFILRAIGDSRTPLIALILASVLNIGFDFLFILGFRMGVEGAGWATVVSQLISGLICFVYMFVRYPFLRLKKEDWKWKGSFAFRHLKIAVPMAFQYSIIAIGLMVQQKAVNLLDTANGQDIYVTSYSAASKIDNFGGTIISALGTAMATFCGQNYGSGNLPRIRKGFLYATLIGAALSVLLTAIILPLGPSFLKIFLNTVTDDIRTNSQYFLISQCAFYFLLSLIYVFRSGLQGLGESNITVLAGITELVMRILACILLAKFFGWIGICLSNPCAWIGSDLVLLPAFMLYMRKYRRQSASGTFGIPSKQ